MKTNECSGCGGRVPARRRSTSGDHWCSEAKCQAQRQRLYRARRRAAKIGEAPDVDQARLDFFVCAMGPRTNCPTCGLADAVPGYAHPAPDGAPCFGVGKGGSGIGVPWLYAAHPSLIQHKEEMS